MKLSDKCIEELESAIVREIIHYSTLNFFYRAHNLCDNFEYANKLNQLGKEFEKVCKLKEENSPISNKAN